jgi:hypothetical protein
MAIRDTLRSAGLGRLAYRFWHQPQNRFRDMMAAGGPLEARRTSVARGEMEAAARDLAPLMMENDAPPLQLHLLTGKRFWYQTAFCLWTFARQSGRALAPVIYDDGTLGPEQSEPLARLFPGTRFVSQAEILARLDARLPASRFPTLRERWQAYPNIRKLTDVHVGQAGWKLVVDSDLLFFHRPAFMLDWLDHPTKPLHAVDCETSYGYPWATLNELAGAPVADLVNVGLTGLDSSSLDWEKLEYWCRRLIEQHGTHYYLEQALIAMQLAGSECAVAPATEYVTKPGEEEARECRAVMHHYVANSKKWFFRQCWRTALNH